MKSSFFLVTEHENKIDKAKPLFCFGCTFFSRRSSLRALWISGAIASLQIAASIS